MSKGQTQVGGLVLAAVIGAISSWAGSYFLGAPATAATDTANVKTEVVGLKSIVTTLCNDYGQTVSRLDQNMQNIAKALKVSVVVGKANSDPCQIIKP